MGYSITNSWNVVNYTRNEYNCSAWTTTTANTLTHVLEENTNDIDRRPKPDDLIANMTAQPKQFRHESQSGIVVWTSGYPKDYSCPYPYPRFQVRSWGYNNPAAQYAIDGSLPYNTAYENELRRKIKDVTINLGTTLAEYRQSVNMFGSAARRARDAWLLFRKKKSRRGVSFCSIPSSFLVYTYGVSPLLGDLYDSIEALTLRLEHPVRKKFYVKSEYSDFKQVSSNWGNGPMEIYADVSQTQKVNCYVTFDLERASLFRYGNPAELLWEVTPYSFVIDGLIPVGDFLAGLDAMKAVETCAVSGTVKVNYNHKAILKKTDYWGVERTSNQNRYWGARNATRNYRSHERWVSNSIPLPAIPRWEPSQSYRKVVNNLFLLWQTFGQRPGSRCNIRKPRYLPGLGVHHIVG